MKNRIGLLGLIITLVTGCAGPTHGAIPMRPNSASTGYLYVGDLGTSKVDVFSYPQDEKVFSLSGFATVNGLCTDFYGDVWVSDGHDGKLYEYLYGQKKRTVRCKCLDISPWVVRSISITVISL